jgi:hypothetical protein
MERGLISSRGERAHVLEERVRMISREKRAFRGDETNEREHTRETWREERISKQSKESMSM